MQGVKAINPKNAFTFLGSFFIVLSFCSLSYGQDSLWEQYKSDFISKDGRVIDFSQNQISHSEGQGYGMLISLFNNDKVTFDTIWKWTKTNLHVRKDGLSAWNWGKRANEEWGVIDYNNASDGDILIAYALAAASAKWNDDSYKTEALKILEGIKKHLAIKWGDRTFILPGYYGFFKNENIALNPSYIIPSAYKRFSEIDDKAFWDKVYNDGMFLIERCAFGKLNLPPDWVVLKGAEILINAEKGARFGYEAIRTILYLSWETKPSFPSGLSEIFNIYEKLGYVPLYVDLANDTISLKSAPAGFYAVYAAAAKKTGRTDLSIRLLKSAIDKAAAEKNDYYSTSLLLLAKGGQRTIDMHNYGK